MTQQTIIENNDVRHAATGNLAFLLSVIRCGEKLSTDEEAHVQETIKRLEQSLSTKPPTDLRAAVRQLVDGVEFFSREASTKIIHRGGDSYDGELLRLHLIDRISTFVAARELARDERAAGIAESFANCNCPIIKDHGRDGDNLVIHGIGCDEGYYASRIAAAILSKDSVAPAPKNVLSDK